MKKIISIVVVVALSIGMLFALDIEARAGIGYRGSSLSMDLGDESFFARTDVMAIDFGFDVYMLDAGSVKFGVSTIFVPGIGTAIETTTTTDPTTKVKTTDKNSEIVYCYDYVVSAIMKWDISEDIYIQTAMGCTPSSVAPVSFGLMIGYNIDERLSANIYFRTLGLEAQYMGGISYKVE